MGILDWTVGQLLVLPFIAIWGYGSFLGLVWMLGHYSTNANEPEYRGPYTDTFDEKIHSRPIRPYQKIMVFSAVPMWLWAIWLFVTRVIG